MPPATLLVCVYVSSVRERSWHAGMEEQRPTCPLEGLTENLSVAFHKHILYLLVASSAVELCERPMYGRLNFDCSDT